VSKKKKQQPEEEITEIMVNVVIHPEGSGILRPVGIGLSGNATVLIEVGEDSAINVITGDPIDKSLEGIAALAALMQGLGEMFSSEEFITQWASDNGL
jgi:hypothetical protein